MVKALINKVNLDHLDYLSNGIYHFAANSSKQIITMLHKMTVVNLNHLNSEGKSPLHTACMSDNADCVYALLHAGANCNISAEHIVDSSGSVAENIENVGTPLHWACSKEIIEILVRNGCQINALNSHDRSALHVMVSKNLLPCVVSLLAHEADINLKDKDGDTPLHIAIKLKLISIVQCLIVFGCDFNMKNKDGDTPRHLVGYEASGSNDEMILYILDSVGAERCDDEISADCPPGCNAKGNYNGNILSTQEKPVEQEEAIHQLLSAATQFGLGGGSGSGKKSLPNLINQQFSRMTKDPDTKIIDTRAELQVENDMNELLGKKITSNKNDDKSKDDGADRGRLLCLDGGGIRGLVLIQMLLEIEQLSHTSINRLFDWIAGTSTGGILALAIGVGM